LIQLSSMKISLPVSSMGWVSRHSARARPILLGDPERLFLGVSPSSRNVCQINPTLAATRCTAQT
jgi:hypothetical protein